MSSEDWDVVRLIDLAEYQNGRATKPSEARESGMPVVKIRELSGGVSDSTVRVDPANVEERHLIDSGDLLFAWSASLGIHVWNEGPAALNQHIFKVTASEGTDQRFLRYLLESQLRWLIATAAERQTTMGHVRKADLERLTCRRPPIGDQRAIAEVLGALDERIEWCGRYRRLLLEMLLSLFRGATTEARELSSVATVTAGQSPPGSTYNEAGNGLPFFQGSAQFGNLVPSVTKWCSEPSRVAEAGDILFSVRAPVGDMNFADIRCCIGRGLAGIRSKFPAVLYAALKSASSEWSIHDASGTVFGSISGRDLRATKVPWPVDVDAVSHQLEPLMAAALAAEEEAQNLRQVRDSLLARLVSGNLRIPNSQALLEPVG